MRGPSKTLRARLPSVCLGDAVPKSFQDGQVEKSRIRCRRQHLTARCLLKLYGPGSLNPKSALSPVRILNPKL